MRNELTRPHPCDYKANICPQLKEDGDAGGPMTRGQDVVAVFVQKHPDLLKSQLIQQELADLISTALTEAYELGEKTMIRTIINRLSKEAL